MNTITHIETEKAVDGASAPWVYCTFALRGKRFVAYIAGDKGDGKGNYEVFVSVEDSHRLNRPSDYPVGVSEALGDAAFPDQLWVKAPSIDEGISATTSVVEIQREVEHRLLEAVASTYLHPHAKRIVSATVEHVRLCEANKAKSHNAQELHGLIKHFLNQQGIEYRTSALASFGSRRAVKYMMNAV